MAGKFLTLEEAARHLGVTIEEINRLVDRKQLFPMRDGATVKFKIDEIERVASSLGDDSSKSDSLTLDLELPTPEADELALGDVIDLGDIGSSGPINSGSQTIVRGGSSAVTGSGGVPELALGDDDDDTADDSVDLVLESNVSASSPSLARPAVESGPLGSSSIGGGPLSFDEGTLAMGSGGTAASPSGRPTGTSGSGFKAPADSGLSLEGDGLALSGIDLDAGPVPGSGASVASGSLGGGSIGGSFTSGSLAGEAFELGGGPADEESASVVIATEESGDSSFFTNVAEDSASVAFEDSSLAADSSSASLLGAEAYLAPVDMTFSGWQVAGLTFCALFLLAGGFVMYEVAWTMRTPQGMPASAPLLDALSATFGWRR